VTIESRLNDRLSRVAATRAAEGAAVAWPDAERRSVLRAKVAIGAVIRKALLLAGADPGTCRALRLADEAAGELAAFPDTPALRRADKRLLAAAATENSRPEADAFDAKITDLVGRYRDGDTPDFATESMASVFAWSLATLSSRKSPT
jgi:hypothetical protein